MGRDRGRGKGGGRGSGGRGSGKKMYIANVEELEKREREVGGRPKNEDDEEEEEEEEEVEGGEGVSRTEGGKGPADETVFAFDRKTRAELAAERAAAAGAAGGAAESDGEDNVRSQMASMNISNPNRIKQPAERMIKVKDVNDVEGAAPEAGMNRKEREALAAARAKEEYQRRHMAGETEQAKRELAQLAIVRARREAAAKQRESDGRAPGWTENGVNSSSDSSDDEEGGEAAPKAETAPKGLPPSIAKKKAALEAEAEETTADGGPPKLKAMDIKKMNGDALKEHLKLRNLDLQGQKKDLMKRLCDYEAARP